MKKINYKMNLDTYNQIAREAYNLGLTPSEYMQKVIASGRQEYTGFSRKMVAGFSIFFSVALTLASVLGVSLIRDYSKSSVKAVVKEADNATGIDLSLIASAPTGLYTEFYNAKAFDQTASLALDDTELSFKAISDDFISGRQTSATFSNRAEFDAFVIFFYNNYILVQRNDPAITLWYLENADTGEVTVTYERDENRAEKMETPETRAAIIQSVIDKYKLHEYSDPVDEINNIVNRIAREMTYDLEETYSSTYKGIQTGEGVCVHYAAAFYILANSEGIPTELVSGNLIHDDGTEGHSWCEVHLDGQTLTVDPTNGFGIVSGTDLESYVKW